MGLSYAIALVLFVPLLLQPEILNMPRTDQTYLLSPSDLETLPFPIWVSHLQKLANWSLSYGGLPLIAVCALATGYSAVKRRRSYLLLLSWSILPVFLEVLIANKNTFFSRYPVAFTAPLLILVACFFFDAPRPHWKLRERYPIARLVPAITLVVLLAPNIYFDLALLQNPRVAPFPPDDNWQFVSGWPAGYSEREAAQYLESQAIREPITVYIRPAWVLPENALAVYFAQSSRVRVERVNNQMLADLHSGSGAGFFVSRQAPPVSLKGILGPPKLFGDRTQEDEVAVYPVRRGVVGKSVGKSNGS